MVRFFGHRKTLHTLLTMGGAALVAAVSYPGKATRIFHKEKRSIKKLAYWGAPCEPVWPSGKALDW